MKKRVSGVPAIVAVLLGVLVGVGLGLFFEPEGLAHEAVKEKPVMNKEGLQRIIKEIKDRILP